MSSSSASFASSDFLLTWSALSFESASLSRLVFSLASTSSVSSLIFSGVAPFAFSRSFSRASFSAFLASLSFCAISKSSFALTASFAFLFASFAVSTARFSASDKSLSVTSVTVLFTVFFTTVSVVSVANTGCEIIPALIAVVIAAADVIIVVFFIVNTLLCEIFPTLSYSGCYNLSRIERGMGFYPKKKAPVWARYELFNSLIISKLTA